MPERFAHRTHGDGRLIMNEGFYRPLGKRAARAYTNVLGSIMERSHLPFTLDPKDTELPNTLLALRQRFQIGFSNGCPWPEKAITEFIEKEEKPPTSLPELTQVIQKSMQFDGKHSFLFQGLLRSASPTLKNELLSYHPWKRLEGQEDRNLPPEITRPDGKGAYGLAYDPPYFDVLIPLYKFIDEPGISKEEHQARFFAVTDFFENTMGSFETIDEVIEATRAYLQNPQYVKQYLP